MQPISLPIKIAWIIDLSKPIDSRWSPSVLKKIAKGKYKERIGWEVLSCENIKTIFYSIYRNNVMNKPNFHLNIEEVAENIERMARNPSYELLWFKSIVDGSVYGGTIIHHVEAKIKVAYRAFDHELEKRDELRSLDYYADYVLQQYVVSLGIDELSRGMMAHPCDNLGLSIYKLSVGARPIKAGKMEEQVFQKEDIEEVCNRFGTFMYYLDPDENGYYTKAVVKVDESKSELLINFQKLATRNNIEISII
jgi:hypothetical protein